MEDKIEKLKEILEEDKGSLSKEQVAELEKLASEAYEYQKKYPHRHFKYNRFSGMKQIRCSKCKKATHNLKLATTANFDSYKRANHKKNRNERPVLDKNGDKIYFCYNCIAKHAQELNNKENK